MEDTGRNPEIDEIMKKVEEDTFELTPQEEAKELVGEFGMFASSLEKCLDYIPEEHKSVREKTEKIIDAFARIGIDDMIVLFDAMEKAHPKSGDELGVHELEPGEE